VHLDDDAPHCARPQLGNANSIATGPYTDHIETADLDGDGRLDVIVTDDRIASAIVFYGQPGHQSPLRVEYPFGPALYDHTCGLWVTSGDVNDDGKLDLVTEDPCAGVVRVLLQAAPRAFAAPVDTAGMSGDAPGAVADMNRDGMLDLVRNDGIALGNGDGTFQAVTASGFPLLDGPTPTAGDLDEDGIPDVAFTSVVVDGNGYDSSIVLAFGVGDGSFTRQASIATAPGTNARALAIADMDGDHHVDLVLLLRNTSVAVLTGHGDGTFSAPTEYTTGPEGFQAAALAIGDIDRDGKPDIAVAHDVGGTGTVLLNDGAGSFAAPVEYPIGVARQIVLADLGGDGILDMLAPSLDATTLLAGRDDGTFSTGLTSVALRDYASVLAMADLDRDGDADAVVASSHGGTGGEDSVSVWRAADGTFTKQVEATIPTDANAIAIADVDGDGQLDIAVANDGGVEVFLRDAAGQLGPRIDAAPGITARWFEADDVDEDGHMDLLAGSWWSRLQLLRGRGDGTFDVVDTGIWGITFAAADLDCDGHLDVVALDTNTLYIYAGDGTGGFHLTMSQPTNVEFPGSAKLADLDGDGHNDLVIIDPAGVTAMLADGDHFDPPITSPVASSLTSLLLADFDRDGAVDAIVTDRRGGVAVLPGRRDGSFDTPVWRAAAPTTLGAAWADVDGDGVRDLVTIGYAFPPAPGQLAVLDSSCGDVQ
jgi:hypothetical protein